MGLTFWEKMWLGSMRDAVRRALPAPEAMRASLSNHNVPETCPLVASERGASAGAEAVIAADMAALHARATAVRGTHKTQRRTWTAIALFVSLLLLTVPRWIRNTSHRIENGQPWIGSLLSELAIASILGLLAYGYLKRMGGEVALWKRLCFDWADRIAGRAGMDGLGDVAEWLQTRWRWFLPPDFAKNDVLWAVGTRRGIPVLAVVEHAMVTADTEILARRSGGGRVGKLDVDSWSRTSVFLQGARFRDAAHRDRIKNKLREIGGGALQCPNGVYLYAGYFGLGFYREAGPTSEIWVDLIDQVVDPGFQGSPSALRELLDELRFLGILPSKDSPHA